MEQENNSPWIPSNNLKDPSWRVSLDDVNDLVKDILADPSINIPGLPDVVERQNYKTTTLLTLNAV